MERRGQFGLLIAVAVAIAIGLSILLFGIGALFSTSLKFYLSGGACIVIAALIALQTAMNGKFRGGIQKFTITLLVIGLVLFLIPLTGITQHTAFGTNEYIQVPLKGFYSCEPASSPVTSQAKTIKGGGPVTVSCPANTDSCDIIVTSTEPASVWSARSIIYSRSNGESDSKTLYGANPSIIIPNLAKGESVTIKYLKIGVTGVSPVDGAVYKAQYKPFILWKTSPTGGKIEYSSVDRGCGFVLNELQYIIIKDTLGFGPGESTSVTTLEPYKTRNFIDAVVPISVENSKIQGNKYCSNNQLYQIDEVNTSTNTWKVVNTNKILGTVECCTGDVESGIRQCQNNKWVNLPKPGQQPAAGQEIKCSTFKPCSGSEFVPYTTTQLVRSVCMNNICVQQNKSVECTSNAACKDPNKPLCDSYSWTCVAVPLPIGNGTVVQNQGQNVSLITECSIKAAANPLAGYHVVKSTQAPSFTDKAKYYLSFGFAGTNTPTTVESCEAQFLPYYILSIILVVLTFVVVIVWKPKRRKRK